MNESFSTERPTRPPHESSVTHAGMDVLPRNADRSDTDATIITSRPVAGDSSSMRALPRLEIGRMLEGERLGQFELRQFVGGGGMGVVFRAWDTTLSREVAVKVLSREQSADEETLRRFRNEAQSAARLDHGNIARVYYVGEDRGVHFIVFEFIEGVNLRDLVDRRGQLPLDEAVDYTLQIARALDHASQRDVIHRDIKPSNVLITAEGQAKLVDMGLARLHQVEHPDNDLTASGVTLGTFDYISPEQARDPRSADVRSDLYSLGCSLFFMLVGRPPFPHGTVLQKLLQHQGDEPPDPRTFRPELPADLVKILRKLLAKNPGQRYQTPAELIWELSAFADRLAAGITDGTLERTPRTGPLLSARALRILSWALPFLLLMAITFYLDRYWSQPGGGEASLFVTSPTKVPSNDTMPNEPHVAPARTPSATPAGINTVDGVISQPSAIPLDQDAPAPKPKQNATGPSEKDSAPPAPAATGAEDEMSSELPAGTPEVTQPPRGALGPTEVAAIDTKPKVTANVQPPLVVSKSADGGAFTSLAAACAAAKPGDIIELRFNGRLIETPLRLAMPKLTLRAAAGFRPIVRFMPTLSSPAALVRIESGTFAATGIDFEVEVPAIGTAKSLALFQLVGASQLQLSQSALTLDEIPSGMPLARPRLAFVEVASTVSPNAGAPIPRTSDVSTSDEYPTLELTDVIARGDGTFLRIASELSARLAWNNGLLVTGDRLIEMSGARVGKGASRVELDLRHLTADTRDGLALLDFSALDSAPMLVEFNVSDSILRVGSAAPLIELTTSASARHGDTGLRWRGDRNFYEGVNVFWRLRDPNAASTAHELAFAEWQAYWTPARETLPSANSIEWKQAIPTRRQLSLATPDNYALSDKAADNPAKQGASDGLDAGAILHRLPTSFDASTIER